MITPSEPNLPMGGRRPHPRSLAPREHLDEQHVRPDRIRADESLHGFSAGNVFAESFKAAFEREPLQGR
ncbi:MULTISPECIES: hypothetical protein [unclassified Streptomyces]|uniref:hypothetical protein n=1 Tax=unclassified Streptomyces TaxID=2593676 RepID=UPI0035E1CE48